MQEPRIIVALDVPSLNEAVALARQLDPALCRVKVGKELFTRAGPAVLDALHAEGFEVFLDLKFHDIPQTVAGACRAACELGVWMINVHALGGRRMLDAARDAVNRAGHRPHLIAVTVLTSLADDDLRALGVTETPLQLVNRLARLSVDAGLDGVVCSVEEAPALRATHGTALRLVTPGIRPDTGDDDQRRTATPQAAVAAGANDLVIGRPITRAADPGAALRAVQQILQVRGTLP